MGLALRRCTCAADVAALAARVRVLEETVAQLVATTPLSGRSAVNELDRTPLPPTHRHLLHVIAAATEGRPFTSQSVFRFLELTGHDDLRRALDACGLHSSRSLGWALRQAWRHGVVARHRKAEVGLLWQVGNV